MAGCFGVWKKRHDPAGNNWENDDRPSEDSLGANKRKTSNQQKKRNNLKTDRGKVFGTRVAILVNVHLLLERTNALRGTGPARCYT